ncbi:MAG: hypothetical protein SCK57_08825, partial [Bacillota bacterium]|nr:hypothetical protein [Bacillota bacterium]
MNNINITDFNNIRKLKEVIELYADTEEKKKVLSREILTMDEGTLFEHYENTIREMDKETNKRLKEIEGNSKSMVEHMTN